MALNRRELGHLDDREVVRLAKQGKIHDSLLEDQCAMRGIDLEAAKHGFWRLNSSDMVSSYGITAGDVHDACMARAPMSPVIQSYCNHLVELGFCLQDVLKEGKLVNSWDMAGAQYSIVVCPGCGAGNTATKLAFCESCLSPVSSLGDVILDQYQAAQLQAD